MKFLQFYELVCRSLYDTQLIQQQTIFYTIAIDDSEYNMKKESDKQEYAKLIKKICDFFKTLKPHCSLYDKAIYHMDRNFETDTDTVIIGPRQDTISSWSTNSTRIFFKTNFPVQLVLKTTHYDIKHNSETDTGNTVELPYDPMTEEIYENDEIQFMQNYYKLDTYTFNGQIEIETIDDIHNLDEQYGLSLTDEDKQFILKHHHKWNDKLLTIYDIAQSNSEHCRHHFFNGTMYLNEKKLPNTLFDLVKEPYKKIQRRCKESINNLTNVSLIAFSDNSSAIKGYSSLPLIAKKQVHKFEKPGKSILSYLSTDPYQYELNKTNLNFVCTAETHNFPTAISPFPGAATGIGGRIRDVQATGKGAIPVCSSAGYCVGKLWPKQEEKNDYPSQIASPKEILIQASNGASDYGNKFGEPIVCGFARSFKDVIYGERREWIKPIMFTGGLGLIRDDNIHKKTPSKGMLVCKIGGPVYKIGLGGSTASSRVTSNENSDIDFSAVQRADPQMEQKMNKVLRTCIELGDENPILSIHDQGAGGNGNVLKELIDGHGANLNLDRLTYGTKNISVIETWLSEYQESNAMLISKENRCFLQELCDREGVDFSILGEITEHPNGDIGITQGKGKYKTVLNYEKDYGDCPKREYKLSSKYNPPINNSVRNTDKYGPGGGEVDEHGNTVFNKDTQTIFNDLLSSLDIGSKRFLTNKVDRSVTGLIAQQQCVGPLHTPLSDYCLYTTSHFPTMNQQGNMVFSGCASSIGEQPYYQFANIESMVERTICEMLFNLVWVKISKFEDIRASANWMWPCPNKDPYQGYLMYSAMQYLSKTFCKLGIAIDGGKDSLSMIAKHDDTSVKSPGSLVLTSYAPVPDVSIKVTPDIKPIFNSTLIYVEFTPSKPVSDDNASDNKDSNKHNGMKNRHIGGENYGTLNMSTIKTAFNLVQNLIEGGTIITGHDCSDGGLFTCIAEMAFAGNCGVCITIPSFIPTDYASLYILNDHVGLIIQVLNDNTQYTLDYLNDQGVFAYPIGIPIDSNKIIVQQHNTEINRKTTYYTHDMTYLRSKWELTSHKLELLQCNPRCATEEYESYKDYDKFNNMYNVYKQPKQGIQMNPNAHYLSCINRKVFPQKNVGIIREEGSNSERELAAAFYHAGFNVFDINMNDIASDIKGTLLDNMTGLAFAGGFSFSDVLGSGNGWYATIKYNITAKIQFDRFYKRHNTFSIGICNGCQLMARLGWIDSVKNLKLLENNSGRFESRWSTVKVNKTNNIFLKHLEGLQFGMWVAHKEGKFEYDKILSSPGPCMQYIDCDGQAATSYPDNPNGSYLGTAAISSQNGRHLAIMPHPERSFLGYQVPFKGGFKMLNQNGIEYSPWFSMFQHLTE